MDNTIADRFELLDRIKDRLPDLDLDEHSVEWMTLDDGHEALLVDGGGIDGGRGAYFANAGEDLHAVGSLAPFLPILGLVEFKPDGTRRLVGGGTRPAGAAAELAEREFSWRVAPVLGRADA